MSFSEESSSRGRFAYFTLALLLAGIAGGVNAIAFFAFGVRISHMTGNVSWFGESFASGRVDNALEAGYLVIAFILGACASEALLETSRKRSRGQYIPALILEIVTLGAVAFWGHTNPEANENLLMRCLAFSMGLQNALTTRVSGAVVRPTHLTGVLTDLGIQMVRMVVWLRDGFRTGGLKGFWKHLVGLPGAQQFERARLQMGLALSFVLGSVIGSFLFLSFGTIVLLLPCLGLMMVIALDLSTMASHTPVAST
ncbi:YoaK family protein [Melittangium boletus]|uniref:DUF1275 domain-containing protein n=1 Tax=Melittangium boletus DSM 14713 TaxID=1294270 RepID=A0A250INS9_9BACT|nr:YoaK family protein [Melittangium boletus]ATB33405.1 hypothetical protein MEBOL_006900 [Melittangium boletus DSM 14713]